MPHQVVGARFLADRQYALLGDEPGAGKTAQVCEAARLIGAHQILVLCPTAVRHHWAREFIQVTGREDINVVHGYPKHIRSGITVTGHSALTREVILSLLTETRWDLIVVDESQEFRSISAARTVNLFGAKPESLWRSAKRVWLLSGSPIVNSAADLYPAFASLFSNGATVPYEEFVYRYTKMVPDMWVGARPTGIVNERELIDWLRPWMLRRANFLDLPPRLVHTVPLPIIDDDLTPIIADLTAIHPTQVASFIEAGLDPDEAISRVRRALGIAKIAGAAQHIRNLHAAGYGPIVVFYHHKDVREALYSSLKLYQMRVSWIDGSVAGDSRLAAVDWFQEGRLDALLVQTQAGGTGITLTRSNHAVVVEPPWTSIGLEQAIARLHRITQTRPVTAEILMSNCWLDEVMAGLIVKKANAAKRLLTELVS